MRSSKAIIAILMVSALVGCLGRNAAAPYVPQTNEEKARQALNNDDFDTAIELLEDVLEDDPENYKLYALIAAAYAGRSGLDIFNIVQAQMGGGDSIFAAVGGFLPANPTAANLSDMNTAVNRLNSIPYALRSEGSAESYGSSAAFQLTLYQSAYSVMYLNRFTLPSGDLDPSKISSMTDADVDAILNSLVGAAASGDQVSPELAAQINGTLAEINTQPGGTTREKLINYMNSGGGS